MKALMKLVCAKAILFLMTTGVAAQTINTSAMSKTVFWSQKALAVQASCQNYDCLALATIFCSVGAPNCVNSDPTELAIICPQPVGGSCVYHVGLEASTFFGDEITQNTVTGLYRFLIDGVPPNPGPAPNSNGFMEWGCVGSTTDVGSGCIAPTGFMSRYVSVVAKVKNTRRNQSHTIEMDAACVGVSGCVVVVNRALARIDVFKQ
jgi:hypothetical protein